MPSVAKASPSLLVPPARIETFFYPAKFNATVHLERDAADILEIPDAFVARREIINSESGQVLPPQQWRERAGIYDADRRLVEAVWSSKGVNCKKLDDPPTISAERVQAAAYLERDAIYLGTLHGHFGHFLVESLTRAWGLAKLDPSMPVIFHFANGTPPGLFVDPHAIKLPPYVLAVFDALKIDKSRLIFANKDLRCRRLHVPRNLHEKDERAHADLPAAYDAIARAMGGTYRGGDDIYITRRRAAEGSLTVKRKSIANEDALERFFVARGFTVVAPETLSFPDQVAMFRQARTVAGTTGSALHMAIFCARPDAHVIAIDWRVVRTQFILEAARGLRATHIFARAARIDGVEAIDLAAVARALDDAEGVPAIRSPQPAPAPVQPAVVSASDIGQRSAPWKAAPSTYLRPRLPSHPNGTLHARRIARIADLVQATSYLEIGVFRGTTFNSLHFPRKTAVDVEMDFEVDAFSEDGVEFARMPSDEYFRQASGTSFDIIFIDGLHTFAQSFRDFCASQAVAHARTVWLIDDVLPGDVFSAMPDQEHLRELRASGLAPEAGGWHGDVYKTICAIHDVFPSFSYATLVGTGHPQTLVWKAPRASFKPRFRSLEHIERLSYFDMERCVDVFQTGSEAEGLERLRGAVAWQPAAQKAPW